MNQESDGLEPYGWISSLSRGVIESHARRGEVDQKPGERTETRPEELFVLLFLREICLT